MIRINLSGQYVLEDGWKLPITNMFDQYGDETDDSNECVVLVAGDGGYWITVEVGEIDYQN